MIEHGAGIVEFGIGNAEVNEVGSRKAEKIAYMAACIERGA
jgi:hypothetical protein